MILADPLTCMAVAIFFESRSEWPVNQVLVANVIQNRVDSNRYPDNICDVVKQKHQFTFYWDGVKEVIRVEEIEAWTTSVLLANYALRSNIEITDACHYARWNIDNYWTRTMKGTPYGKHTAYEGGC